MNYTENYQLNQWDAADPIRREDFNADNVAIDAAIAGRAGVATGSYVGTGTYGQDAVMRFTFEFEPKIFLIGERAPSSGDGYSMALLGQEQICNFMAGGGGNMSVLTWEGNSISWYSAHNSTAQFNSQNTKYFYAAIG